MDIKKLFALVFCMIFLVGIVSALELNPFADIKIVTTQSETIDKTDFMKIEISEYPLIQISKTFFWFEQDRIAEYKLTENTKICGNDCFMEGKAVLYEDGTLFEDADFKEIIDGELGKSKELAHKYFIREPVYSTYEKFCSTYNKIETCIDKEIKPTQNDWVDYNYETLRGDLNGVNYEWRLEGSKDFYESVDAMPINNKITFTEWADWGAGGTITYDGLNAIHTFLVDGSFNVSSSGNIKMLIVAGGGGASMGGGGAGGVYYNASYPLTTGDYEIKVGAGGTGDLTIYDGGNACSTCNGGNSSFGALFDIAGGGAGGNNGANGVLGGSGGGGGASGPASTGGAGITGQGFAGGGGDTSNGAGGGGGKAEVGATAVNPNGASGGNGLQYDINGTNLYYAGGGGGSFYTAGGTAGTGGLGGGADGNPSGNGADGTDGLGGGGGGAFWNSGSNTGGDGGNGIVIISYLLPYPILTLNSPAKNTNQSSSSIVFNCSATHTSDIISLDLIIDGVINQTITNSTSPQLFLGFQNTINDLTDGDHTWNCNATDNLANIGTGTTRTLTIDTIDPTIVAIQNLTNQTTFSLPVNSTWIINATDTHLGSCWYNTTDDATLKYETCNAEIQTEWTTEGDKTIYYYVNDTFGNEVSGSQLINIALISATSSHTPDISSEGGSINFNLYVNKTNIPTTTAYLYFNNTIYTPTSSASANYYLFSYNFSVPDNWGNSTGKEYSYYWNYTINGLTSNESTTADNFTIYSVEIDDCSTFGQVILNFSLYDQESNDYVNATAGSKVEIDLELTSGSISWAYANSWINNATGSEDLDVLICVPDGTLNNTDYQIDYALGFQATDHVWQFFYLDNGTLTNGNNNLNSITKRNVFLMDLLTTDSTSFLFNYFDSDGLPVEDSIVHVFRKYIGEGVFREVERAKQDENGDTIIHLVEEDVIYQFIVSLQGTLLYTSSTYTALCQAVPCTLQLEESGGFQGFNTTDWDLIDGGSYLITSSSATRVVNLTYVLDSPATMNLTIYSLEGDGSYNVIDSEASTSTSGTLLISVPTISGNTTFFASVYQDDVFKKSEWVDFEADAGLYFGNVLSLFLGALIILALGLMAVTEGSGTIIFLMLGMFIAMVLGLVDYRTSTGLNILIYFMVAGGIILWKLTRRQR